MGGLLLYKWITVLQECIRYSEEIFPSKGTPIPTLSLLALTIQHLCLSHSSCVVKRQHNQSNFYKKQPLAGQWWHMPLESA